VSVNLFIPSEVRCADHGVTIRQETGFPDAPLVRLTVTSGFATMALRVRVPSWAAGPPVVVLNGAALRGTVAGDWIIVERHWQRGDLLEVTLPMRLAFHPAPDAPTVQAVSYGPVVLAGRGVGAAYAASDAATDAIDDAAIVTGIRHPSTAEAAPQPPSLPLLDTASVRRTAAQPMAFTATADGHPVTLVPVARAKHEPFTVYWQASPG
jgi:hypothetical protein